jgi:putative tryptophan/tyrosine transport system substrate-binding protein
MSLMAPDLGGKRLEILKDMLPALSRVAILWNAANPYPAVVFRETESAARKLGVEIQSVELRSLGDFDGALGDAVRHHPSALITVEDPLMLTYVCFSAMRTAVRESELSTDGQTWDIPGSDAIHLRVMCS